MAIRQDLIGIEDYCPVEIYKIASNGYRFDNLVNIPNNHYQIEKLIKRLSDALLLFRLCKADLRNLFKPEINKYIDSDTLNILDENLGRVDQELQKSQKELISLYNDIDFMKKKVHRVNIKLNPFRNLLVESMETIIVNPIINSTRKYMFSKGEKLESGDLVEKDEYLFIYYLFQEVFPASQSVGGLTRQEFKTFPKNFTIQNQQPNLGLPTKEENETEYLEEPQEFDDVQNI